MGVGREDGCHLVLTGGERVRSTAAPGFDAESMRGLSPPTSEGEPDGIAGTCVRCGGGCPIVAWRGRRLPISSGTRIEVDPLYWRAGCLAC